MKNGLLIITGLALLTQLHSADWPQWQGPKRNAISEEKGLLKQWPANGPTKVWHFAETGFGYGGPAIAAGKIYIMGTKGDEEFLMALDEKSGKPLWSTAIAAIYNNNYGNGPRGTPAVDGDRVYGLGGQGTLVCLNAADGKLVWKKRMQDLGGSVPHWGYAESVLVDGDNVICTPGGSKGALAALDKKTGAVKWQSTDFTEPAHYSSVIAANHNGARQLIQLTEKALVGVNAADGKVLWKTDWPGRTAVIPTPVFHNGHVYITSGYGVGCKLVKIGADNKVEEVYNNKEMVNHHGGVVLIGDHIYGHSDRKGWLCQKLMTGEQVWIEKEKLGKGAVTAADGQLYLLEEESGQVVLIDATPEGWREKGRFKLAPQSEQRSRQGRVWTHPVIANGKLYLRDQEHFVCYDISSKG